VHHVLVLSAFIRRAGACSDLQMRRVSISRGRQGNLAPNAGMPILQRHRGIKENRHSNFIEIYLGCAPIHSPPINQALEEEPRQHFAPGACGKKLVLIKFSNSSGGLMPFLF
jgi:hypothetical protein